MFEIVFKYIKHLQSNVTIKTNGSCSIDVNMPVECGGEVDLRACHAPLKPRLLRAGTSVHRLLGHSATLTCDWETEDSFDHTWYKYNGHNNTSRAYGVGNAVVDDVVSDRDVDGYFGNAVVYPIFVDGDYADVVVVDVDGDDNVGDTDVVGDDDNYNDIGNLLVIY